jgi:ketosteroid isomerase-like protein
MMSETERNKALALKFFDAMRNGDADGLVNAVADDGLVQTMGSTPISAIRSKDALRAAAPLILGAFPKGLQMTIHNVIGEGEYVAVEAESFGQHLSGKIYNNRYHWLFRFRDGEIVMLKEYMDTQHLADVFCGDRGASQK